MALQADNDRPSDAECRNELERLLASPIFKSAPKLASFLRFVVTSTLNGQGERLKGYTVGVEALGRPATFDPQIDPIVRVEAIRLRIALERYYAGAGARDPLLIEMPRGRYVARFRWRAPDRWRAASLVDPFARCGACSTCASSCSGRAIRVDRVLAALRRGCYHRADIAGTDGRQIRQIQQAEGAAAARSRRSRAGRDRGDPAHDRGDPRGL